MLKELLKRKMLLENQVQKQSITIKRLTRQIVALQRSHENAVNWPLNLFKVLQHLDQNYQFQNMVLPKSGGVTKDSTIIPMNQVAMILANNQEQKFCFTKIQRIASGGHAPSLSIRLEQPLLRFLSQQGFNDVHFFEIKRGIVLNVGLFDIEHFANNRFKLIKQFETTEKAIELKLDALLKQKVLDVNGYLILEKIRFKLWNERKRERQKQDSLQKQTFHSRFTEALEGMGYFRRKNYSYEQKKQSSSRHSKPQQGK